ncbi:MAG: hypothetical protein WC875_02705, partial [Candidatus Absconditabacterales bacterium]
MKKISLLLGACALIFLAGCGNTTTPAVVIPNAPAQFQTYDNPAFSIQYPAIWNYQENAYGTFVIFFSP